MLLFLVDLINIEIFRISFSFFYSFSFILRSRATSVWYQSITSIQDQVVILVLHQFLFVSFKSSTQIFDQVQIYIFFSQSLSEKFFIKYLARKLLEIFILNFQYLCPQKPHPQKIESLN